MSGEAITVLLVEDSDDMASMLEALIGGEPDLACAGRLPTADGLLDAIARARPRVVLMDLTMPGREPMGAMAEASERFPDSRFVVLSGYDDPGRVDAAVSRGAWGFVSKLGEVQGILDAIRAVAAGEAYLKPPRGGSGLG